MKLLLSLSTTLPVVAATLLLLGDGGVVVKANPDIHSNQRLSEIISHAAATESQAAFTAKVKTGEYVKIGSILGNLVETMSSGVTADDISDPYINYLDVTTTATESSNGDSEVLVDVIFERGNDFTDGNIPQDFVEMGFRNQKCNTNVCLGYAKTMNLVQLSQHRMVNFIKPSLLPVTNTGSVTSEGDMAMNTDLVRETYGLSGSGITVCAMSDSFDCDSSAGTDYADDIASGDLPTNVNVLVDITPDARACIDEGRAMLQLIYDVAPSSNLGFRTAVLGAIDFAQGVLELAEAGCDVIVDDIGYGDEPFFQDGVVTQAVDNVFSRSIPYFSSAGNSARRSWHTDTGFVPSGSTFEGGEVHNFGTDDSVDEIFAFAPVSFTPHLLVLQWDEPFASVPGSAGCQSDVDVYILDLINGIVVASGTTMNIDGNAIELLSFPTDLNPLLGLVLVLKDGPAPGYMKLLLFGRTPAFADAEYDMVSSTSFAHPNAAGAAGVGAASWQMTPRYGVDPAVQEDFSSAGGTPIFFDTEGNRLGSAEIREQPRFTGPDAGLTTFFQPPSNRFFGTSAAAPHVAALAALMLEADSTLTPTDIYTILQDTAGDMDDTATNEFDVGFDFGTGYGFVQGDAALAMVVDSSPTSEPTPLDDVSPTSTPSVAPTADPEGCASCDKDVCGPRNRCLFRRCSRSTGVWLCERRREVTENGCRWNRRNTWQCDACARKGQGRLCCRGCGLVVEEEGLSLGGV